MPSGRAHHRAHPDRRIRRGAGRGRVVDHGTAAESLTMTHADIIGWMPFHQRAGFWCSLEQSADRRDPLPKGWRWVPIYAKAPT